MTGVLEALIAITIIAVIVYVLWRVNSRSFADNLLHTGHRAQATITGMANTITYEFTDHMGQKITNSSQFRPSSEFIFRGAKLGDTFTVVYQPDDPSVNYPEFYLKQRLG